MTFRRFAVFAVVFAAGLAVGHVARPPVRVAPPADYSQPIRVFRADNHPHVLIKPHSVHIDGERVLVEIPPAGADIWFVDIDGGRVVIAGTLIPPG